MSHTFLSPLTQVQIQSGSVVSKVIHRDENLEVTVFGFDAGEGLTEHQASRVAIVQVLSGQLRFTVDDEDVNLVPGSWLRMAAGAPHSLIAVKPTIMLLSLTQA